MQRAIWNGVVILLVVGLGGLVVLVYGIYLAEQTGVPEWVTVIVIGWVVVAMIFVVALCFCFGCLYEMLLRLRAIQKDLKPQAEPTDVTA